MAELLKFHENQIEKHRLNADCYMNHFTTTRPYGMVPGSPRILIQANSVGLAFAVPKTVISTSRIIDIVIYDLWTGNVYKISTNRVYHKYLTTPNSSMINIQNGIFHFYRLYVYGRFTTDAHFFMIVFNFEKITWELVCVLSSDPFFPFPVFSSDNFLHVLTHERDRCSQWVLTCDQVLVVSNKATHHIK